MGLMGKDARTTSTNAIKTSVRVKMEPLVRIYTEGIDVIVKKDSEVSFSIFNLFICEAWLPEMSPTLSLVIVNLCGEVEPAIG